MVVVLGIVDPFLVGFTRMNDSLEKAIKAADKLWTKQNLWYLK